ncbi:MAG: MBL fold metallo-hydrolase, partial [Erysipelotrichaceae bacterium]|nr:MBL fold metallo-hydrolase [Erysipelotrichaceae bacterium]
MIWPKKISASLLAVTMAFSSASTAVYAEEADTEEEILAVEEAETYDVAIQGEVTDAGEYVSSMTIDFGDKKISGLTNETFEVYAQLTVDYGAAKGQPYGYYDASKPIPVVKTEMDGGKAKVYFDQSATPVLTWLAEGRNYPAIMSFTINQVKPLVETAPDGRELEFTAAYNSEAASWKDLENDELAKFTDVQDVINYQFHKGTNDKLIVFFHGNGEGDFPTKDTNNNVAQILANRGGVAWVSEEAQAVFGDASVMAFQAPDMWYFAVNKNLLEPCYDEIQKVIAENGINPDEVYVSGASAGGFMTTRMIIAYPDLFKAAMINCPALDAANARSGSDDAIPTDEELAQLIDSDTGIWLVQGETDSSVDPEECSKRIWNIITDGKEVSEKTFTGDRGIASGFTTYETADGKYKLSLYETFDLIDVTGISGESRLGGKLKFAEDYDQDGEYTEVKYSDHWSWIYTLRNNPEAADGTHIWQWALNYVAPEEERDIEAEKAAFKAALEADGYAEMGSYKVEKMKDGIYHMDEETRAVPGGATIPDYIDRVSGEKVTGVMNNPSSMYLVVNETGLTMIDAGDVLRSQEKFDSARAILEVMSDGKPISFIITHGHSDHVRLITTEGLLDGLNIEKIYVDESDYADGSMVGSTTGTPLPVQVDLDKVAVVKDGDKITVNGLEYEIMEIACHTPGSLAIVQRDKEAIFTGDSIGSGFVWAFWMYGDNPLGKLQDGVKALQGVVNSMASPKILAGHRWQQFSDMFGADKPNEIGIQYLNDMNAVLNGLADGTTKRTPYTLRNNPDDIELSATGSKAKVDTQQEPIDAYLAALVKMDEAYVYSGASKLSIESENATAAPTFIIYPDKPLTDEEAQKLLDDSGLTEILDRAASSAYVMRTYDMTDFRTVMQTKVAVSQNFNLIGIGDGATFINENLTPFMNSVSGLALIGGEKGNTPSQSVPAYVSGADASAYIAANKAEKTEEADGFTTYVNPESRFELVVVNEAEEEAAAGIKNAWEKVLCKFGRIGNWLDNSDGIGEVGTWYSRPIITGDDAADSARLYQYFDSIEAIDNIRREVVTEDIDGDGQLNLWYEYIPEQAEDAEEGTVPMVLLMHGNTNDPRTQYDCSGWANIASEEGIILVAPEWQGHTYQGYTYQPMTMTADDVDSADFVKMIKMIEEKYPQIDASRVYIEGLSAGSRNAYMQGLANAKYLAAGAGQSGPFGVTRGADNADVLKNKDKYDFPIIFFSGDADEYLMGTYDNTNINNGAFTTLNAFEALNDMDVTAAADLDEALIAESGYPVAWDETYTIEPGAENIPVIKGGIKSNDADVEISFNRIYGWGHWNYMPDARMMWDFMKKYARDLETGESIRLDIEYREVSGTQIVEVTGDDWGPAVEKTVITLDEEITAESLDPDKFFVTETKEAFDWSAFQPTEAVTERKVLDVYLSDEKGEVINAASGKTITVVMYISPNEGSPFYYDVATGFNRWVDKYNLSVSGKAKAGEETVKISVASDIDFYDNDQWFSPVADLFKQDTFEASDGTPIVYGEFAPAEDDHKNALFIWLHGAGEGTNKGRNDNYIDLLGNKITAFAGEEFQSLFEGAYVVTPQAPTMWMDGGDGGYQSGDKGSVYEPALFEFIEDYVKNNDDVDPDRIIIGGCSNGGYMTMEMIIKHPDYFYKAYPICEAFADEFITDEQIQALADSGMGIWFTFADADTTVNPAETSIPTYNRLKEAGADVHKTQWADVHDTTGRFTDAEGNPYVYAGHWSWIYFDNNENFCDDCGLNEWEWLAEKKSEAIGTQVIRITGDDWGPGIDRTVIHFSKKIDPEGISAETFTVTNAVNRGTPSARTVLDAYTSDAEGNKVSEASEYVTIDLRITPLEGNPIVWSMQTWTNSWANPYELFVELAEGKTLVSEGTEIAAINVGSEFDVRDMEAENVEIPQLEDYEFGFYEAADGYRIPYGFYTPENADDGNKHALIIWNHGVGERGMDARIALLGNEVTALSGEEFQTLFDGAYVLVPQQPTMWM